MEGVLLLSDELDFPFPASSFVEGLLAYLVATLSVASFAGLAVGCRSEKTSRVYDSSVLFTIYAVASLLTWTATGWDYTLVLHSLLLSASLVLSRALFRFDAWMQVRILAASLQTLVWPLWTVAYVRTLDLSPVTRIAMYISVAILLLRLPFAFGTIWIDALSIGRRAWLQPRSALPLCPPERCPRVSVHVPCYAEPPAVVIATLEALARIDYPDDKLEVIVIDNNTKEPALWKPVEAWCSTRTRFRFFHVSPLRGAKPGAQNFALRRTLGDIICCVDADFQLQPDFLRRFVGFFDDHHVAGVQSAPDFRGVDDSTYSSAIYWMYMMSYRLDQPIRNEIDSSNLLGPSCLVRRSALEEVGGWAEWAVCEDTEVCMRLRSHGWKIHTFGEAFSTGLMPDNFDDFRKQWFRWYVGSYQQFWYNWRLLLPNALGGGGMTTTQKYWELYRVGQPILSAAIFLVTFFLSLFTAMSALVYGDFVGMPANAPLLLFLGTPSAVILMLRYIQKMGGGVKELLRIALVGSAISHLYDVAMLKGTFSRKPPKWSRTSKFNSKATYNVLEWIRSVGFEWTRGFLTIAVHTALCIALSRTRAGALHRDVVFLGCLAGLLNSFLVFVVAPMTMVVLAHLHLQQRNASGIV